MKKTYGVCLGLLALGLVGIGTPTAHARSLSAASEAGNETTSTTAASTTTALSQADSVLVAENDEKDTAAPAADAPQDQGTPAPATPAPATPAAAATAPAAPAPLSSPSMTAPLSTAIPHEISAGPFGKLQVTGILSGGGMVEGDHQLPGPIAHWDLSNAQVFVQKTSGWFQFYLQGGAYNVLAIGTPFIGTGSQVKDTYGPLPVGYIKLVKGGFSLQAGELPTLIGAEYTFSFENLNIERGLLWAQEPAISRGIQLNEAYKKLSLSFAYTDGFFSNRYTSLSGSLAYAFNAANTLTFVASGNAGAYARIPANPLVFPTPLNQNNSEVYNLIYTYTREKITFTPYFQYTSVAKNPGIGIMEGAHTASGALMANYNFNHGFSLPARFEYIKSAGGSPTDINSINLLYGPGSGAVSFTVTPTYQKDGFFLRGEFAYVHITSLTPGLGFKTNGTSANQPRGVIEAGIMF
jgi:Putative beta-barrel porin-2, OmpL-like. bbp2